MATETPQPESNVPDGTIQMMTGAQLNEPKSTVGLFTLPCGYLDGAGVLHTEVLVKEMTGREEDMLSSDKVPDLKKMTQLMISCIARIGSIVDRGQIAEAVPNLLVGDRVFLMIAIRRTALGDNYPYKDKCPSCEKESLMNLNLSELETAPMREPMKRLFEVKIPSKRALLVWSDTGNLPPDEKLNPTGRAIRFRPLNGADEEKMGKILDEEDSASQALKQRVVLLDGKAPSVDELQALTFSERAYLRTVFNDADGGVETLLDVTCPHCDHDYQRELNTRQMGFFFPSAARKNSKTRSST